MRGGGSSAARASRRFALAVLGALLALAVPGTAWAHGRMSEQPPEANVPEPDTSMGGGMGDQMTMIEVRVPKEASLGAPFTAQAVLTDERGAPIAGMTIVFEADAVWSDELQGHMVIGTAVTDRHGVALLSTSARTSGSYEVAAYFPGNDQYAGVMEEADLEIHGDTQLYSPAAGIKVPWLNLWLLAAVIAIVWSCFLIVAARVVAISRPPRVEASAQGTPEGVTRRQFLGRAVPFGAAAGIAAAGAGLVTVVARSPHTHGNLMAPPSTVDYRRTPVARLGQGMAMREMPGSLDRPVSFRDEVLPIFLANGGPHAVAPLHSPPPGGLRLDSYEGVMAKEGVVVPGKPEDSELIEHLLSVGMQMPPSVPPLPDDQIQLIVSWIAQGARNN